ncbi:ATP-binding cassette domain-containing protein [Halorubrum sp. CBA1125]|uniref:ATP-binding cassette domain-containing protein n=1 Tax=Halorubrum sp. CBA1125 TaxID=2668072 RepID=UPI0012E70798|nr:ATP-binding cassette domain-containing protein [Halorubrum sp. CBA1125]MUW14091.1 ATP-binding cassette domain-containing protein [Halorubrum sp. CBA1125]
MSAEHEAATEQRHADSADAEAGEPPKLQAENLTKQFGRIVAVDDVSLEIRPAEVFALVGDNGAGKSTLMNMLSGVHEPTKGQIYKDGQPVNFSNPADARATGIETVYQDLALMDDLDIATNIFMGQFPRNGVGPLRFIDWDETYERAEQIMMEQLGRDVDIKTEVEFLSGGQRQLVAIGRALAFDPDVIILDEPTSALSVDATRLVQDTIEKLADQGITIVIVSHNIESVLKLADRIGVLFRGSLVNIKQPEETDLEELNELMTTGTLESKSMDE